VQKSYRNDSLLFISDTHMPYMHRDALPFLKRVKELVKPERTFHVGDLTDQYVFSSYPKTPEADGVGQEMRKVWGGVRALGSLFPDMIIVSSNHDDRIYKRSRTAGIPKELVRPYNELIKADKFNWKWVNDYTLRLSNKQHLYITHTKGENTLALAKAVAMNVVVGHHHNKHAINFFATPHQSLFAIDTGCLIEDSSYAFAYNKMSIIRPMLGCAAIINGKPLLFTMKLNKAGRWTGSV
jgi:predicted phosphodiesterase